VPITINHAMVFAATPLFRPAFLHHRLLPPRGNLLDLSIRSTDLRHQEIAGFNRSSQPNWWASSTRLHRIARSVARVHKDTNEQDYDDGEREGGQGQPLKAGNDEGYEPIFGCHARADSSPIKRLRRATLPLFDSAHTVSNSTASPF
jgi:hypothetical protein